MDPCVKLVRTTRTRPAEFVLAISVEVNKIQTSSSCVMSAIWLSTSTASTLPLVAYRMMRTGKF